MLTAVCEILRGLSYTTGNEPSLNLVAYNGLIALIETVYGDHAANVVSACFCDKSDDQSGVWVCFTDTVEQAFLACLIGEA